MSLTTYLKMVKTANFKMRVLPQLKNSFKLYLFIFRERGREGGREEERERNIDDVREKLKSVVSLRARTGNQIRNPGACSPTGNRTRNLSLCRTTPNPLSHTGRGPLRSFLKK